MFLLLNNFLEQIFFLSKKLILPGDFRFYGLLGFNGQYLISDFIKFWKSLNEIVPYETYIIL